MRRGLQGAAVVLRVHHGHVGAAVVQHLLHAVDAAALAARADRGAGDGVVAAQAVHLAAGRLAVLHRPTSHKQDKTNKNTLIKTCTTTNELPKSHAMYSKLYCTVHFD